VSSSSSCIAVLLESTVSFFADQPSALLPINRRRSG
jgi:hypothetical protein